MHTSIIESRTCTYTCTQLHSSILFYILDFLRKITSLASSFKLLLFYFSFIFLSVITSLVIFSYTNNNSWIVNIHLRDKKNDINNKCNRWMIYNKEREREMKKEVLDNSCENLFPSYFMHIYILNFVNKDLHKGKTEK